MKKGIIGKKLGMTQIFDENGVVIPVTVIEAGPCPVTQKKTVETDGYDAVQLAYGEIREKLGDQVEIRTLSEENVFTLSSRDSEWPVERVKREFGLVSYKEYHSNAEKVQDEWRNKF